MDNRRYIFITEIKERGDHMFREMRRIKQVLSKEDSVKVLENGTSGVLAVHGDDGYPYSVPLSYVYQEGKVFFHCAKIGHKVDAITSNEKVSFCVIDKDQIVPEEYTTYFRSVIVFGKAHIISDPVEKRHAIEKIAERYSPMQEEGRLKVIDNQFDQVCLIELDIEHMSGKEAIELVRAKEK